jgi:transposase
LNINRLYSHSKETTEGIISVKFIAVILYQLMSKIMREQNMFKDCSISEICKELSKIKIYVCDEFEPFISEVSKKQKDILHKFNLEIKS